MNQQEDNPKYQDIMKTAHDLFWKHGFRRVSVEEICKKSGVSKMTFYRFFSNKSELAKAVFDKVVEDGKKEFENIMNADISGAEKVKGIIRLKIEGTNDISKEFMEDFYFGSQPELKKYVEEKSLQTWNEMIETFKRGQEKGWFRKDFKPEFVFQVSFKMVEVMNDEKLLKLYDNPQDLIIEFTNFFAYGISAHD